MIIFVVKAKIKSFPQSVIVWSSPYKFYYSPIKILKGINDDKYIICVSEDQWIGLWNTLKKEFIIYNTFEISAATIYIKLNIITFSNEIHICIMTIIWISILHTTSTLIHSQKHIYIKFGNINNKQFYLKILLV